MSEMLFPLPELMAKPTTKEGVLKCIKTTDKTVSTCLCFTKRETCVNRYIYIYRYIYMLHERNVSFVVDTKYTKLLQLKNLLTEK